MRKYFVAFFILAFILVILTVFERPNSKISQNVSFSPTPAQISSSSAVLGFRTKTNNCVVQGSLPDIACTPGAIFNVTKEQVCVKGYASSVRNVPQNEKDQVYLEYGITSHVTGQYEVDHLISLELGGSNDISNLWPEAANPTPGFHQKDVVENYLHQQVCLGKMSLSEAQRIIVNDWFSIYTQIQK